MLAHAIAEGVIPDQPLRPTAHVLLGALDEAALFVSRATNLDQARQEMDAVCDRLISGIADAEPVRAAAARCRRTRATGSRARPLRWYAAATSAGPATASSSSRCEAPASCQPVIRPSTTRGGRSGPSTRSVQPVAACTVPSGSAADSSSAGHRGADGDHPPDRLAVSGSTSRAVAGGTSNGSAAGGSPCSAEDTPACRVIGAITIPDDDQRRHQLGAERPCRTRHLGAARLPGEDRLIAAQRPGPRDVAVADRPPVPGEVGRDVALDRQPCDPQPTARHARFGDRTPRRRARRRPGSPMRSPGSDIRQMGRSHWRPAVVRRPRRDRRARRRSARRWGLARPGRR